jgi:hypothetical protein
MTFLNGVGHCNFRVDKNQPQKIPLQIYFAIFYIVTWHKDRGIGLKLFHWKINVYKSHKVRHVCKILI